MSTGPTASFACSTCGRQYRYNSHLRRHEATHSGSEVFKCQHCGKAFRRRDVLRKHWLNCSENITHNEPPPAKRGKKPTACDACYRSKLSCDGELPCARCKSRKGTSCSYTRTQGTASNASLTPSATIRDSPDSRSTANTPSAASTPAKDDTKIPVSFLLGLTDPNADSMLEFFRHEPTNTDDEPSIPLQPEPSTSPDPSKDIPPDEGFFFPWLFGEMHNDPFLGFSSESFPLPELGYPDSEDTGIDPSLEPIVADLERLHTTLTTTDPSYDGTFDSALAKQIFTRSNLEIFVPTYFRYTHLHLPLVHRPTFNVETSSPALVLTVFLCGSLYAPPRDCVLAVPPFFRVAEEYVFRRLEEQVRVFQCTKRDKDGDGVVDAQEMEMYQTLQAAVVMQGAQFLMNYGGARSRAWVRRGILADVVRRLGLTRARHTQGGGRGRESVDWARFVRDETRIRIATWTALGDWQQAGMVHQPGFMTTYEMTAPLPCVRELWEAKDAAVFESVLAAKGEDCWRRSASLSDCMDALMAESWSGVEGFPLRCLTVLDLHLIASALHVTIGVARFMSLLQTSIPALQRTTDRWQDMWNEILSQLDDEEVRRSGFVRYGGELGWLASAFLRHSLAGKDNASPYYQRIGHSGPKELHDLMRELREEWPTTKQSKER